MKTVSVLIVDDHPIVIAGIKFLLEPETDFTVEGIAHTPQEAIELSESLKPGIIVLDLFLSDKDGIRLIQKIRSISPESRILIYSTSNEFSYAERCLKSGAAGYLMKSKGLPELANAIKTVKQGHTYLSDALKTSIVDRALGMPSRSLALANQKIDQLTNRELQIMLHIGTGKSTGQIARHFNLSPKTVGAHREHIKNKLGINTSPELVKAAINLIANQVV